jgi:UDP:flavonoid glycosyltransferase YjiC (YdhE family)
MVPRDPSLRIACFTSPHLCPEPPAGVELLGVMREALPQVSNDVPAEHQVLVRDLTAARERGAPVVLLSMGTVVLRMLPRFGAENLAFLKRLYTTLAAAALKSGAVVVASTCDLSAADLGVDDTTLGAPGRVFVMPFVPQPLLFSRGLVDVMLMHGGANTLHETVLAGIPVLVCPGFGDQGPVSHAVAQLGLGTRVESITYPGASDAVSIERAADEILPAMLTSSSSKSNARRFAAMVREDNGLAAFDMALHAWL